MNEIVVRYKNQAEAARALKKLRRFGLRSPRDHWIVAVVQVGLVMVPILLLGYDVIRPDHAIAVYFGYFGLRWFTVFLKPWILHRFGPKQLTAELASAQTLTLDATGVRCETEHSLLQMKWRAFPPPEVYQDGLILRIAPEQSLVVAASHLPDGISPRAVGARIQLWRTEDAA